VEWYDIERLRVPRADDAGVRLPNTSYYARSLIVLTPADSWLTRVNARIYQLDAIPKEGAAITLEHHQLHGPAIALVEKSIKPFRRNSNNAKRALVECTFIGGNRRKPNECR
jgi:hypothetical protein